MHQSDAFTIKKLWGLIVGAIIPLTTMMLVSADFVRHS
jgi:hypothetical protein